MESIFVALGASSMRAGPVATTTLGVGRSVPRPGADDANLRGRYRGARIHGDGASVCSHFSTRLAATRKYFAGPYVFTTTSI